MSERRVNSILAVDFGSVNARALLFEKVDGFWKLAAREAAPTTSGGPQADLAALLEILGERSGRRLVDETGRLIRPAREDRVGVDYFLTSASAGPPLRAALVGLYPQVSIAAARRAIAPFYIDVAAEAHLEDGSSARGRLNRIVQSQPQLIFIAGGMDGGARTVLLETLALAREAVSLMPPGKKPTVLYAGNNSLAPAVREMLGQQVEVMIAPNIRQPGGEALEPAQEALGRHFDRLKRGGVAFRGLAALSDSGFLPTARGLETMTAFFGRSRGVDALAIDFGSAKTMLCLARPGQTHTVIRNDIGLGHSAATALEAIGEEAVARWLPFQPRKGELKDYARGKGLTPSRQPLDMRQRAIEYALLRRGIRLVARDLPQLDRARVGLVILAGATLGGAGQGALDMLLLADALELEGVIEARSDPLGALPALGAMASVEPTAVVQLVDAGVLEAVGALIRVSGRASAGAAALRIEAKVDGGEMIDREVKVGDVWHLPVPAAGMADLRIQASRGLSIGGRRRLRLKLAGGRGGLLFDARLDAPGTASSMRQRAVNMLRWHAAVIGRDSPVAIPESWLAGVEE